MSGLCFVHLRRPIKCCPIENIGSNLPEKPAQPLMITTTTIIITATTTTIIIVRRGPGSGKQCP